MSSLQWVKVHVGLINNPRFRKLGQDERWTFVCCLLIAGELGGTNELLIQGWGPMTALDIAAYTGIPEKKQELALQELVAREFLSRSDRGGFVIEKWDEKAGEDSSLEARRKRQREYQQRKRLRTSTVDSTVDSTSPSTVESTCRGENASTVDPSTDRELEKELVPKGTGEAPDAVPAGNRKKPSVVDLAAYKIMDAALPVILAHGEIGFTQKAWRQRNKAAAADLVELGRTPEDVVAMLEVAYASKFYNGITTLAKLQEHWPKLVAIDSAPEDPAELQRRIMRGDFLPRV